MPKNKNKESLNSAFSLKPLHQGISVPDIEKSIAWYTTMLGFSLVSVKYVPPLKAKVAFLDNAGFSIELFQVDGAAPLPEDRRVPNLDIRTHGTKHVAYAVQDIYQYVNNLKAKGVDVAMDVFSIEGELVAFIRDNTGNLIELIQRPVLF